MSLLRKIGRVFKPIERALRPAIKAIAPTLPGVGPIATAVQAARALTPSRVTAAQPAYRSAMQQATQGVQSMSLLPALPSLAPVVATGARVARTVGPALRRYGGTAAAVATAGAVLYDAAGNPVRTMRKRRAKGITARELKSFTRVTGILNKYCKTPPPMKRRTSKGRACR